MRDKIEYFDETYACFGRVISGWDIIDKAHALPRSEEKPDEPIIIAKCGELRFEEKLKEEQAEFLANYERDVYAEEREN